MVDTYVQTTLKMFDGMLRRYENWKPVSPGFEEMKRQELIARTLEKVEGVDEAAFTEGNCALVTRTLADAVTELENQTEDLRRLELLVSDLEAKEDILKDVFLAAEGINIRQQAMDEKQRVAEEAHKTAQEEIQKRIRLIQREHDKEIALDEERQASEWDKFQAQVEVYRKSREYDLNLLRERQAHYEASCLDEVRESIAERKAEFDRLHEEQEESCAKVEAEAKLWTVELEELADKACEEELEKVKGKAYGMEKQNQAQEYELQKTTSEAEIERLDAELSRYQLLLHTQGKEIELMQQVLKEQMAHKVQMAAQVMAGSRMQKEVV